MPGSAACLAKLALTQAHFEKLGRQGIKNWSNEVLRESQMKYCPVDTGALRRSGRAFVMKNTMTEFYMRISYVMNYAAAVHEIPMNHNVGSMKYLATPFNLMSYRLLKKLEAEMKGAL